MRSYRHFVHTFRYPLILIIGYLIPLMAVSSKTEDRDTLRILTINAWSGLDYLGVFKFGEYEDEDRRMRRYASLIVQIRALDPDIVFIQEANRIRQYTRSLSRDLGMTAVHHVVNAGLKFGPIGFPVNFREGLVILARPEFNLEFADAWKLSGMFGLHGDYISMHFNESTLALAGRISVKGKAILLVNAHLHAAPVQSPEQFTLPPGASGETKSLLPKRWEESIERNRKETIRLLERIRSLPPDLPIILAGDFNAAPQDSAIRSITEGDLFIDAYEVAAGSTGYTWDYRRNDNIRLYINVGDDVLNLPDHSWEYTKALYDTVSRRIDYIFLSAHFRKSDVIGSRIVLDEYVDGLQASDHFGVLSEISFAGAIAEAPDRSDRLPREPKKKFEPLPILMFDTDIGFGYGAKAFALNLLGKRESLDLVAFNSTKGERWYRLVFSVPDFELRQGKIYPVSFDLIVDYDKYIRNNYFGIGNASRYDDRESYTREPFESGLMFGHGFLRSLVGQVGLRYVSVRNFNFEEESRLVRSSTAESAGTVRYVSVLGTLRFDSRNNFINPSRGSVLQGEFESVPGTGFGSVSFTRLRLNLQHYIYLFHPATTLALRSVVTGVTGKNLPVQVLLPLGGGNTLRGYSQDRFLDRMSMLINAELRFPIYKRIGGIAGIDAGRVVNTRREITTAGWKWNPAFGLRYYFDTFLVRVDVGTGRETTGIYFNFGHIF